MWLDGNKVMVDIEDDVQWWGRQKMETSLLGPCIGALGASPNTGPWGLEKLHTTINWLLAWEANWGKKFTLGKVPKGGFPLANRCYLSQEGEETMDHLLFHCAKMKASWDMFFSCWSVLGQPFISLGYTLWVEHAFHEEKV